MNFRDDVGLAAYGITIGTSSEPQEWISLKDNGVIYTSSSKYFAPSQKATYYFWVKDVAGRKGVKEATFSDSKYIPIPNMIMEQKKLWLDKEKYGINIISYANNEVSPCSIIINKTDTSKRNRDYIYNNAECGDYTDSDWNSDTNRYEDESVFSEYNFKDYNVNKNVYLYVFAKDKNGNVGPIYTIYMKNDDVKNYILDFEYFLI